MNAMIRALGKLAPLAIFALLLVSGVSACGQPATTASTMGGDASQQRSDDEQARWHARLDGATSDDELARWHARLDGNAGAMPQR